METGRPILSSDSIVRSVEERGHAPGDTTLMLTKQ
jgi:hypothetical protein